MRSTIFSETMHDAALTAKKLLIFTLFALAVMTALIPVSTSAFNEFSIFNVEYTHQQLKFRLAAKGAAPAVGYAAFVIGAVVGTVLFSFVSDRKKSAFYFSLGMSRGRLFAVRAAVGTAAIFIVAAVPTMLSVVLNCRALGCYEGLVSYAAAFFVALFFQSLFGMIIFGSACLLSGTPQEALCAGITLSAAPSVIIFFINALMKNFTWGNIYGAYTYNASEVRPSLTELTAKWNPLFMAQDGIEKYNSFSRDMSQTYPENVNWTPFVIWVLAAVIGFAVVAVLFRAYKAERSGMQGLFGFTYTAVSLIWPAAAFSVCMEYTESLSREMSFAVAAAAAAVVYVAVQKLSGYKNGTKYTAAKGAFALAAVFIVSSAAALTGGAGLYYALPENDEIESTDIVYTGQMSYAPVLSNMTSNGAAKYYNGRITLSSDECVSAVKELDNMLREQGKIRFSGREDAESLAVPYDLHFTYRLSSGKTVERYYDRITAEGLGKFLRICGTDEVREQQSNVIKGVMSGTLWNSAAFSEGDVYICGGWLESVKKLDLSKDYRNALLNAAAEDICSMTEEELYHPSSGVLAEIMFTLDGEEQLASFSESNATAVIYVTESWKCTAQLLKEWNVMAEASEPAVSDVLIQKFDLYSSVNGISRPVSFCFGQYSGDSDDGFILKQDFGNRPDITDEAQITELMEASRGYYYMDGGGYLLAFRMSGSGAYVYRFLPYDDAPYFIKDKM